MSALLELAERCELATGPDRELDAAIAIGLGAASVDLDSNGNGLMLFKNSGGPLPKWTASLDAAMTLVPEGWEPALETYLRGDAPKSWHWTLGHPVFDATDGQHSTGGALALCAAALRATAESRDAPSEQPK